MRRRAPSLRRRSPMRARLTMALLLMVVVPLSLLVVLGVRTAGIRGKGSKKRGEEAYDKDHTQFFHGSTPSSINIIIQRFDKQSDSMQCLSSFVIPITLNTNRRK